MEGLGYFYAQKKKAEKELIKAIYTLSDAEILGMISKLKNLSEYIEEGKKSGVPTD